MTSTCLRTVSCGDATTCLLHSRNRGREWGGIALLHLSLRMSLASFKGLAIKQDTDKTGKAGQVPPFPSAVAVLLEGQGWMKDHSKE